MSNYKYLIIELAPIKKMPLELFVCLKPTIPITPMTSRQSPDGEKYQMVMIQIHI